MVFTVLFVLFACHFAADFTPLSTRGMLAAKAVGTPAGPIFAHALVHGLLQLLALLPFVDPQAAAVVCIVQTLSHWLVDTGKGNLQRLHAQLRDPKCAGHWVLFGADQLMHTYVILLEVALLCKMGAVKL
jgi:hypothetical protein